MTSGTEEATGVSIDIDDIGPCVKKIRVEISLAKVEEERATLLAELAKDVELPGFRKGKAPKSVIEKRFGEKVQADVAQRLIQEAYSEAIIGHQLQTVGDPAIEEIKAEAGAPLSFAATVEIFPDVDVAGLDEITLTREVETVSDEEIDRLIESERERNARFEPVEDGRGVVEGDFLMIDYSASDAGEPIESFQGENRQVHADPEAMFGDFFENIKGMTKGETREFESTLPDDFPEEQFMGKAVTFTVTLNEIKQKNLPDLDDDFAREISAFDTLAEYRADIEKALTERNRNIADNGLREELLDKLIEKNSVDLPPNLVMRQAKAMTERARSAAERDGSALENEAAANSEKQAVRILTEQALLTSYGKKHDIQVTEEDLDGEIAKLASMMNVPLEMAREQLGKGDGLSQLSNQAFHDKVYAALFEAVTINDSSAKED